MPPPSSQQEASLLRQLLAELQGGDGVLDKSWVGFDPCGDAWAGVTCEMGQEQMQVVGLDLSFREFRGPLPQTLALLLHLQTVSFLANE
jgi:hypothetical protein